MAWSAARLGLTSRRLAVWVETCARFELEGALLAWKGSQQQQQQRKAQQQQQQQHQQRQNRVQQQHHHQSPQPQQEGPPLPLPQQQQQQQQQGVLQLGPASRGGVLPSPQSLSNLCWGLQRIGHTPSLSLVDLVVECRYCRFLLA